MLLRFGFDQCCEVVGRASAIIAIAGMASLVFAAIVVDVFRESTGHNAALGHKRAICDAIGMSADQGSGSCNSKAASSLCSFMSRF